MVPPWIATACANEWNSRSPKSGLPRSVNVGSISQVSVTGGGGAIGASDAPPSGTTMSVTGSEHPKIHSAMPPHTRKHHPRS
jgi:hypothetical protein